MDIDMIFQTIWYGPSGKISTESIHTNIMNCAGGSAYNIELPDVATKCLSSWHSARHSARLFWYQSAVRVCAIYITSWMASELFRVDLRSARQSWFIQTANLLKHMQGGFCMHTPIWLVVSLPLWKIWKWIEMMKFPIYGKKHVSTCSNHHPVTVCSRCHSQTPPLFCGFSHGNLKLSDSTNP